MGLDGAQRFLTSFKTAEHDGTLEGTNDESGELLCVYPRADFPRFHSGTDHQNKVAAPATQGLARARTQDTISVISIVRRVEQWTASGYDPAPFNKIRNELLEPVDGIRDGIEIANP